MSTATETLLLHRTVQSARPRRARGVLTCPGRICALIYTARANNACLQCARSRINNKRCSSSAAERRASLSYRLAYEIFIEFACVILKFCSCCIATPDWLSESYSTNAMPFLPGTRRTSL